MSTPSPYLYADDLQDSFVAIAAARLLPGASTTSKNCISLPTFSGVTHSEDGPRVERPVRKTKPTAALLQYSEKVALPSQRKTIDVFRAAEAAKRAAERDVARAASQNDISKTDFKFRSQPLFRKHIANCHTFERYTARL